ncbi:MAG: DUF3089 domain-containing protein [Hyphomonadaceae bacterium]|nr:DUF3089 domain-containing protein [Hyphomonadaceae bacterium]
MRWTPAIVALALLAACGGEKPQDSAAAPPQSTLSTDENAPAVEPVTPVDYALADAWLCRPDKKDACEQDLSVTAVTPDGKLVKSVIASVADPNAPIDCFYVYPTVSLDTTPNSDLVAGPEEMEVVRQQFASFGTACKLYAPMYRQVTLPALRQLLAGEAPATNREMAYADVKAAWDRYLANDNNGRGVVLIGHSQGAGLLTRLIAGEIDGKPVQDRIVSALLIGTNLSMGTAHDGGGSFKEIGLCVSNEDINCAISYVSFRADAPPSEDSLFGTAPEQGMHAACVNPADLDGSAGALKAMLPTSKVVESMAPPGPWTTDNPTINTPFVSLPGLLSAKCVSKGPFSYLAITINADTADKRTDTIPGDVVVDGKVQPAWGLHLVDMNLALGNLVDIVKSQAKAYRSRETSRIQHPQDDPT